MTSTRPTPLVVGNVNVMGIVNVTPDSFSGDGLLLGDDYIARALGQAEQMVADGAGMIDIGGESSRPGSVLVSVQEEIRRTAPVIAAIKNKLNVPLAIDTVKAEVATAALQAGATIINDIRTLADPHMREVAARHQATVILMHNRSAPDAVTRDAVIGGNYKGADYSDVVADVARELAECADKAIQSGIAREKIILDPGIGFGKNMMQNLTLIAHLKRLKVMGFPLLMGVSRKSFIGQALDAAVDERLEGTAACVTACVLNGADIVRVHDVAFMARIVKMAAALRDA